MPEDIAKRNKRQENWRKENKDRLNFLMPKGYKDKIKAAADADGISAAEWIRQAIDAKLND